jgi:Glycosyltransferase family 87
MAQIMGTDSMERSSFMWRLPQLLRTIGLGTPRRFASSLQRALTAKTSLLVVLAFAAWLRVYGMTSDLPSYYHPDEAQVVVRAFRMVLSGDFNPHFFKWPGSLVIYFDTAVLSIYLLIGRLLRLVSTASATSVEHWYSWTTFYVLGRLTNVAAALATVWLVSRATSALGRLSSLTAALLVCVSPLHISESAIALADVPAALFLMAAGGVSLRQQVALSKRTLVAGILIGLGAAIKYYTVVGLFGLAATILLESASWRERSVLLVRAGVGAAMGFLLGCPFAILAAPEFFRDLAAQYLHQQRGHVGFEPSGWSVAWYFRNSLVPALGLPAIGAAVIGAVLAVRRHRRYLPVVVTSICYLVLVTRSNVSFPRYAIPHVPLLAVLTALALSELRTTRRFVGVLVALIVLLVPGIVGVVTTRDRAKIDTREAAQRWLEANLAPGSTVLTTQYGPVVAAQLVLSPFASVTEEQFASVQQHAFDCAILSAGVTERMERVSSQPEYELAASSHLRLYSWIRTHNQGSVVFAPSSQLRGPVIEIYVLNKVRFRAVQ